MTLATTPGYTIRQAQPGDGTALASLRQALFQELGRTPPGDTEFKRLSIDAFQTTIANGTCVAWLALGADRVVGSLALLIYPRLPSPESAARNEGYIISVYTAPEWRRQGIGTALVETAIAASRELGLGRVRLHASLDGQPVYAAAGFRARFDEMELRLWETEPSAG